MRPVFLVLTLLGGFLATAAQAEVVRLRYVPVDAAGNTALTVDGQRATGTRSAWYGGVQRPFQGQFRPNFMVTFLHPYTGRMKVPMTFPEGTPRLERRRYSIVYNYGSYTVEAQFQPDGSVETIYNSGLLRPLVPR